MYEERQLGKRKVSCWQRAVLEEGHCENADPSRPPSLLPPLSPEQSYSMTTELLRARNEQLTHWFFKKKNKIIARLEVVIK